VEKTSDEHQVDPKLVHAIIQVESGYNPHAVSNKGAQGLMQLIPATAERYGVQNTFNPKQNIEGGVSYLKYLLGLFKGNVPLTLAAYNAGEHAVIKKGGIPQYSETLDYVQRVTDLYNSGSDDDTLIRKFSEPQQTTIFRLVDARGVVHYTNGDGL
jgi:soluble lytic murein transglycosylase-like protein